jgi:hypothetical protein
MDESPGVDVFPGGLMKPEFLGPLHVVALISGVNAGPGNGEIIEDLHSFELDKSSAAKPCGDDVLAQLGMGPGGRTYGRGQGLAKDLRGKRLGFRLIKKFPRDTEDGPIFLELR